MSTFEYIIIFVPVCIALLVMGLILLAIKLYYGLYKSRREAAGDNEFIAHFEVERSHIFMGKIYIEFLEDEYNLRLQHLCECSLFMTDLTLAGYKKEASDCYDQIKACKATIRQRVKDLLAYCEEHRDELIYFYPKEITKVYLNRGIA